MGAIEVQVEYEVAEEENGQYIKPSQSVRYCISIHSFPHLQITFSSTFCYATRSNMKVTLALLFGLSALPLSLCKPVDTASLLVNGNFETGSLSPWVAVTDPYAGDITAVSIITPGDTSTHAGNLLSDVINNPQDYAEMYQYFGPLCAGESYTMQISYKISSESKGTADAYLSLLELTDSLAQTLFEQEISLAGTTVDSLGNAYGEWHSLSYSFQPNSNLLRIAMSAVADDSSLMSVAFDNISVQ
jgi:hypothetical protein